MLKIMVDLESFKEEIKKLGYEIYKESKNHIMFKKNKYEFIILINSMTVYTNVSYKKPIAELLGDLIDTKLARDPKAK